MQPIERRCVLCGCILLAGELFCPLCEINDKQPTGEEGE